MNIQKVNSLIDEALEYNKELFLVQFQIANQNQIDIVIDGNKGVTIDECVRVSRFIENNLDRETEDFSILVSSPDISKPISHIRQYNKNLGRILKIETDDQKYEGKLVGIEKESIFIEYTTKEPKPIGKGKHVVTKTINIEYNKIKKAIVKIVF